MMRVDNEFVVLGRHKSMRDKDPFRIKRKQARLDRIRSEWFNLSMV